ncbi:MAG TPA: bi-domain-containing oxidoreductase [Terriglobales bacterium]|jgi:predicted dehydrogenase/threonine dehydrogenase-like Zn-dependent dehydrogenase|nr:bi-domain-containing oxidoreductase [Terriglobales bacterium]
MKQLLQDARTGELSVTEVPPPQLLPGCVLVRVAASLVSAGTERASAEFASKNLAAKAKARPDLVRDVLAKLRRDGLLSTMQAVRSRLDQPQSVGYSSSGVVMAVGDGVVDINVGDRVACAGAGYAVHAELACVPRMLVAKIPAGSEVPFEEAAFGTVGAICLHGIRTAGVSLGDTVAVIGLGLLGQITVQQLKAAGCRVLGMDLVRTRTLLAMEGGAESACSSAAEFRDLCFQKTGGAGVDSVLITAETASSEPVNLAAEVARDRAVVVAVGTVGMNIERKLYYGKELDFRVSRSYGPGRYDTAYEQKGRDYPIGHVRWTETRNLEAFLQMVADGKLNLAPLITHRFPRHDATRAYDLITGRSAEPFLGVVLTYPEAEEPAGFPGKIAVGASAPRSGSLGVGVLGAGNFAQATLLPALKSNTHVSFAGVCNATGPRSRSAAEKFGFQYCAASEEEILRDPNVHAVVIATRHHLHAAQVQAATEAGKAVFCEKPICLTEEELAAIVRARARQEAPLLMVGFNRRFAPMAVRLKEFVSEINEPLAIQYRVNAGYIPADHWVNDLEQGGGRILGEVCHFVDLVCFLAGSCPVEVQARTLGNAGQYSGDNVIASLRYANGTLGTITYLANGDKAASKERVEVFGGGSVGILDDFRTLELVRHGRRHVTRSRWRQDKGHRQEMQAFIDAARGMIVAPIPFEQIVGSTLATLRLQNSCQTGEPQVVALGEFVASALHSNSLPHADREGDPQ